MKRLLCLLALAASAGCDRGAGKGALPPGKAPLTDAQAAEASWRTWHAKLASGDAKGAWECLSKRSRAERSSLYRADAARIHGLAGAALESEARSWGTTAAILAGSNTDDLAALALVRESARLDGAEPERSLEFAAVRIAGEVATVSLTGKRGPAPPVALVHEDGQWKLDDIESRKIARH